MNNKNNSGDLLIGLVLLVCMSVYFIINEPFLITLLIPICFVLFSIYVSGTTKRDTYFKSKRVLLGSTALIGLITLCIFYLFDKDFLIFGFERDSYMFIALLFVLYSAFFAYFSKKLIPISFLDDDDRLVQETMYEDYDYKTLDETYAYRGISFVDQNGSKITPDTLKRANGKIKSLELNVLDLEMVALNKKEQLKFYYEKVIFDFYRVFTNGSKLTNNTLLQLYGYNFTFNKKLNDIDEFKIALKNESLFYYKIFEFLEKDMKNKDILIQLNFKNIYKDNLYCLEFILISAILMVRQYMNFPVGDLMKYVKTKKDKNFLGCFSSLPADYYNVNSTSITPSGIAYYYIYYKLHLNWFSTNMDSTIIKRWVKPIN